MKCSIMFSCPFIYNNGPVFVLILAYCLHPNLQKVGVLAKLLLLTAEGLHEVGVLETGYQVLAARLNEVVLFFVFIPDNSFFSKQGRAEQCTVLTRMDGLHSSYISCFGLLLSRKRRLVLLEVLGQVDDVPFRFIDASFAKLLAECDPIIDATGDDGDSSWVRKL